MQQFESRQKDFERKEKGLELINAVRTNDAARAGELLDEPASGLDLSVQDDSGMSCLHHVARLVNPGIMYNILGRPPPHLANLVTYFGKTPARWLPMNCLADQPHSEFRGADFTHCGVLLAEHMSPESMMHFTANDSNVIHVMIS